MQGLFEILQILLTKEALFLYLGLVIGVFFAWIVFKTSSKGLRNELKSSRLEKEHLRKYFYSEIERIQKEKIEQKQNFDKVIDNLIMIIKKYSRDD